MKRLWVNLMLIAWQCVRIISCCGVVCGALCLVACRKVPEAEGRTTDQNTGSKSILMATCSLFGRGVLREHFVIKRLARADGNDEVLFFSDLKKDVQCSSLAQCKPSAKVSFHDGMQIVKINGVSAMSPESISANHIAIEKAIVLGVAWADKAQMLSDDFEVTFVRHANGNIGGLFQNLTNSNEGFTVVISPTGDVIAFNPMH